MTDSQSRYTYDGTEILINKEDIRNEKELEIFERQVTLNRLTELEIKPVKGRFDTKHMCDIHQYIFQDIYLTDKELKALSKKQKGLTDKKALLGKLRDEDIMKGSFRFASARFIGIGAEELFGKLKSENYLGELDFESFTERLAFYMAEINVLHIFREGNGRSTREFIRELAAYNGYQLDYSNLCERELLQASIKSVYDISDLTLQLRKAITL